MKKAVLFLFLLIGFGNTVFSVAIIPEKYSVEETAAANLWARSRNLNDLKDENLIFPGNLLIFEWPYPGDRHMSVIYPGDYPLKMAKNLVSPKKDTARSYWIPNTPVQKVVPIMPQNQKSSDSPWFWILAICLLVTLLGRLWMLSDKRREENKEILDDLAKKDKELQRALEEIQEIKNKLPVIAPEVVDEEWLKNNNPVEPHSLSSNYYELSQSTIERVFGKKPDLIVNAIVSTEENAIDMEFSHFRQAKTGLKNVAVWLGWNWDTEKVEFVPVGMIASICSNGFEINPERVEKMSKLFTSVDLVKKDQHPVYFWNNEVIPDDTDYPDELISSLVVKYHENNITDLRKAGVLIKIKQGKK